jgi:uncharacterized membrane protein YqjE
MGDTGATAERSQTNASTSELISQLSEQSSRLIREELQLAQAEVSQKAKRLGVGAGMFGAAGLIAFFGLATLITTAILALTLLVDAWLASLIVMVVLFVIAAVLALVAKRQVARGVPPVPERTIESVKQDVETVKESAHHDDV